jgi:glycine/D-amino acid oxidase-like deaminating enzyme
VWNLGLFLYRGEITMAKERLVVIGGDAAGMSTAAQAKRLKPEFDIIAFEKGPHTSYSA